MKFFARILQLSFIPVLFSCNNKLELNAPYKEMPTVYALMNPMEKIQIIRVNKVFLGEGDANVMAKVSDSVNYKPGELNITLNRFVNGNQVDASPGKRTIVFRDSSVTTLPGAFTTQQMVYVSSDKLYTSGEYVLKVRNVNTGNEFVSRANSLDSVKTTGFAPFTGPYYPVMPGSPQSFDQFAYIDYSSLQTTYLLRFKPNEGKIYQLAIRIHFYDSIGGSDQKFYNYVDYNFANQYAKDVTTAPPAGYLEATMRGADFFNGMGLALPKLNLRDPTTIMGRKTYKMQFFIYSSSQDYMDYLQYSAPSFNISQVKPLYSNFENKAALGIFAFRTRFSITKEMKTFFVNEFARNPITKPYKFYTSDLRLL